MKRTLLLSLLILLVIAEGRSQIQNSAKGTITFNGVVKDAATTDPLPNSQIFINRAFFSVSDSDGTFAVIANRGDTIMIRLLGYQPAIFHVSDTLSGREFLTGVYMNADTLSIGEVVIVPRLSSLRNEIFKPPPPANQEMENARYNMAVSAYQGRMAMTRLDDPASHYAVVHQQMRTNAFEKGTIPSDRMVGLSPFMLVSAAYLLLNGLPPKPDAMKPVLTAKELEMIHRKYLESKGIK